MANNLNILDGNAAARVVKTTDNAGVHTTHHNVDSTVLHAPPTAIYHGQLSLTVGTKTDLGGVQALKVGVRIKAGVGNAAVIISVGDNSVDAANGFQLSAGNELFIAIDDRNKVKVFADGAGSTLSYIGW